MAFEPLGGWREVQITERRQRGDRAHFVRDLADGRHKDAGQIVRVMDPSRKRFAFRRAQHPQPGLALRSLPARRGQARRTGRFAGHRRQAGNAPPPKHGPWLNMAEIELSVFRRDLPGRVASKATLERHAAAWQRRRNAAATTADCRFTTADARIKLRNLYPSA